MMQGFKVASSEVSKLQGFIVTRCKIRDTSDGLKKSVNFFGENEKEKVQKVKKYFSFP